MMMNNAKWIYLQYKHQDISKAFQIYTIKE
jgi:hypothetical protein